VVQQIPIQIHVANALQWLGTLYRTPADALKEHVSNAIDEHLKARLSGGALSHCHVRFTLERKQITIEYPYGMSRTEFESALQRVADSQKRSGGAGAIGRLGIGIFSFQQVGRKCVFFSRKSMAGETLRVTLKEGSDQAALETALSRDSLGEQGLRVVISDLKFDPTKPRGPLSPEILRRYLSSKFDTYLREGWFSIELTSGIAKFNVTPSLMKLPRLLAELPELRLLSDSGKRVQLDLRFDASGKGCVALRHRGVTVVEDLGKTIAYGLEDSIYGQGSVRGTIDADFLEPLPSRSGFEENSDWVALLDLLDGYRKTIETEVQQHLAAHRSRQAADIQDRALRIAREILDLDEFQDLALPTGLAKKRRKAETGKAEGKPDPKTRKKRTALPTSGDFPTARGTHIRYEEVAFENNSSHHSRFVSGVVQANTLHADYVQAAKSAEGRLAYAALMIGKETIAFNDRSGLAGDFLEKLLDFYFKLQNRPVGKKTRIEKRSRQKSLDL
jgi:hypothetical protein